MKKRFKNILMKSRKKNGFYILIGAVILTINFGSLVNCSVAKEKPSTLVNGDGYSVYLSDGEWQKKEFQIWYALSEENGQKDWQKEEIPVWYVMSNEEVRFWVAHFDSAFPIEQMLTDTKEKDKAYHLENDELVKQEDEIIYRVKLHNVENDTWCVGYCYPMEVEEEWGSELSAMADTFVVTVSKKD